LAAARGSRLEARWIVGLSLGLRQGEVLGLWWEDVDLDAATLRVNRQFVRSRRKDAPREFAPLKTRRSRRVLALPTPLVAALSTHREAQRQERVGARWADPRVVFATPTGTPIDHRADARAYADLLDRAGVRRARLHDLRHTAATLLLAQGVPARVVMEMFGHSQISLTMNTYSHVSPTMLGEAARSMEAALWGTDDESSSSAQVR
jgi:integrase